MAIEEKKYTVQVAVYADDHKVMKNLKHQWSHEDKNGKEYDLKDVIHKLLEDGGFLGEKH
jgi:hypothetical protein